MLTIKQKWEKGGGGCYICNYHKILFFTNSRFLPKHMTHQKGISKPNQELITLCFNANYIFHIYNIMKKHILSIPKKST